MTMDDLPAPPGPPVARTTPRPPGLVGRIFLDREPRLRIGWRLLSYLTLVMAATAGVAAVIAGSDPPVGRNLLAHLVAVALVVAITWLYRHRVDRRGWRDLGLPLPGRPQLLAAGAGFGLGVLVIVGFFGAVWVLGWARVDGGEAAEQGVAAVAALLVAGLVMYAASALVHTRVGGPDLLGGPLGGVELLYALTSALLLAGYWRFTRRHRAGHRACVPAA
jgi:hypothetical protein